MTTTTRATFAACLFAAFVAGTLAPKCAPAHPQLAPGEVAGDPQHDRAQSGFYKWHVTHDAITLAWEGAHHHYAGNYFYTGPADDRRGQWRDYHLTLIPLDRYRINHNTSYRNPPQYHLPIINCALRSPTNYLYFWELVLPDGCIQHNEPFGRDNYEITITGLKPNTVYGLVQQGAFLFRPDNGSATASWSTRIFRTAVAPDGWIPPPSMTRHREPPYTETVEKNPPAPVAQTCTYEHRFTGVPGTTANAYNGRIRLSSKEPNATATIRAYQAGNGHRIDVLDAAGRAVETVSLAPAYSVKLFTIEAIRGWHPVIVTHPSAAAMQAATVAMRIREPGGSVEDSYPPAVAQCQPASGTGTPAPDLAVRSARAVLWDRTLDWFATVENVGAATAPETTARMYYGDAARPIASTAVHQEVAAGSQWPMSSAIDRGNRDDLPPAGATVRICVDAVPGEPASKRANNCASVTVERN